MPSEYKMIASYDEKTGWEVEVERDIPQPILSYQELRMAVIALFNQGTYLQSDKLTFAHRNVGKEYHKLASRLDSLLSKLEPYHLVHLISRDSRKEEAKGVEPQTTSTDTAGRAKGDKTTRKAKGTKSRLEAR